VDFWEEGEVNAMDIQLVKATLADGEQLLAMQKTCFAPHLRRYQDFETNPAMATIEMICTWIQNDHFYKIFWEETWVGAISIREEDQQGRFKLHIIHILPEFQGKGIGQRAIRLAESQFPHAQSWCLETLEDMPQNRHVYEKLGYHFTGQTEKVNERLTLVFYEKQGNLPV